jgi:uncharacterized membrane protein YwaF
VRQLGTAHVGALLVTALLAVAAARMPAGRCGRWAVPASRSLALLIAAAFLTEHAVAASRGIWSSRIYLPLHLSDAATLAAVLASGPRGRGSSS